MGRFFNTAGPCQAEDHYTLDPLTRLSGVRNLVDKKRYFILHAPRQTGKTTTMISFMQAMNQEGKYIALYANVEPAQAVRHDVAMANEAFVRAIVNSANFYLPAEYRPSEGIQKIKSGAEHLKEFIQNWCLELPKPLVLFLDEANALIGDSLLSLLRQLRSGYPLRPTGFPHSVALIGLRDIRDYRIYSEHEKRFVIGGSAFNIKDESLTMSNFTPEQIRELYAQHTAETGQAFTDDALSIIYEQTMGQPWLVNAIGKQLCFSDHKVPVHRTVIPEDVYRAVEMLIQRRDTHLDHLTDKLSEPRVAKLMDVLVSSGPLNKLSGIPPDDIQYAIDLGLVVRSADGLEIANPIYREVIPRDLTWVQQMLIPTREAWYTDSEGKLDMEQVLTRFFEFYKENSEMLREREQYTESVYHLAFMAWMQRIVNGGGNIRREYAAGRGFVDVLVEFRGDRFAFELKTEQNYRQETALAQIAQYLRRMSLTQGYLLIFRKQVDVDAVGKRTLLSYEGLQIHVIWV